MGHTYSGGRNAHGERGQLSSCWIVLLKKSNISESHVDFGDITDSARKCKHPGPKDYQNPPKARFLLLLLLLILTQTHTVCCGSHESLIAFESLKCGLSELRCAVTIKSLGFQSPQCNKKNVKYFNNLKNIDRC